MKIKVKNLGVLKQAEFTLGDLTIICGGNNTGKTYATYALYGFLSIWEEFLSIDISSDKIEQLLTDGVIHLDLQEYVEKIDQIVAQACELYTQQLSKVFASQTELFKETEFQAIMDVKNLSFVDIFHFGFGSGLIEMLIINKNPKSTELIITLIVEKEKRQLSNSTIGNVIARAIKRIIFHPLFPRTFIASAERTGAVIFRKELIFARSHLLDYLWQADASIDTRELLLKNYEDYALPIKQNVSFNQQLETMVKKSSFIAENHPDILADFADIIGGEYKVTQNDQLYYQPKGKRIKLSMDESSSGVRSLLDIGFYLKHEAAVGDLLMVDEPELNLHPENQRRVARLFARLVNLGIKVFITTHSDYIIKELNTLIMLNHDRPHLKRIAEEEGYRAEELLSAEKIKIYIAEKASIILEGQTKKTKCQTLTPADIDPEMGIEARSFDKTIETMNRIQEAIVWGKD
jgi:predicted ATP-dependent endonuclease of OLD family